AAPGRDRIRGEMAARRREPLLPRSRRQPRGVGDAGALGQLLSGRVAGLRGTGDYRAAGAAKVRGRRPDRSHRIIETMSCTGMPVAARTACAYGGRLVHSRTI